MSRPFTKWPFQATGGTAARTMPDRIADVFNVKDYGAKGDNSTDDSAAIQAAINASGGNGTIFFPTGTYIVNTAIDLKSSISISLIIQGVDAGGTVIKSSSGVLSDYIFKYTNGNGTLPCTLTIEGIGFSNTNSSAGGCLQLESGITPQIRNCDFNGFTCISLSPTNSATHQTTGAIISSCHFSCSNGSAASGSWGIFMGSVDATVIGCTMLGFDHGIRFRGAGHTIIGCQIESNFTGIMVGMDASGANAAATACLIAGGSMENNATSGIYVNSANFLKIEGQVITFGTQGPPAGASSSQYGIQIASGSKITVDTTQCTGAFTSAGINMVNVDNVSKTLFINSDTGGTFSISAGTKKSNIQFINMVNAIDISTGFALLPGQASNTGEPATHGERRLITDSNTATFNSNAAAGGANKVWVTYDLNRAAWVVG